MPLTNTQYNSMLSRYQERQLRNRQLQEEHIRDAYQQIPRLAEIHDEVSTLSMKKARILLHPSGNDKDFNLDLALSELADERRALLLANGYPADYLELPVSCSLCHDTGYTEDGRKCSCFLQMEVELLYDQSNLKEILQKENFEYFSLDYYSDTNIDPRTGRSSRAIAERACTVAKQFTEQFGKQPENLCIYGDTGVGKTFLSHCIAKELIEKGFSVLYLTAFELFDSLETRKFSADLAIQETHRHIFDCDLLIIDDLGSELNNSFTTSQLFLCINQRILDQKAVIISTNLSVEDLRANYSERIFSRILSSYKMIPMYGRDIRIQKQLTGGQHP
ncbi:MAG: ATP-binding protein [Lachnospiraceae bacterium]|nr:ATP-binding protein [Lachnospiraceae bacterium]